MGPPDPRFPPPLLPAICFQSRRWQGLVPFRFSHDCLDFPSTYLFACFRSFDAKLFKDTSSRNELEPYSGPIVTKLLDCLFKMQLQRRGEGLRDCDCAAIPHVPRVEAKSPRF